jgi:hypothetical protein
MASSRRLLNLPATPSPAVFAGALALLLAGCAGCPVPGPNSLFVATFEADGVGARPAASAPLVYGPENASLTIIGPGSGIVVLASSALGSKALEIARENSGPATGVVFAAGDLGDLPCCGTYVFSFRAHGRIVPAHRIAAATIAIKSFADRPGMGLLLFDGAYHLIEAGGITRLAGSYNPAVAHSVAIGLNLSARTYSVCVNNEPLASNKPLLDPEFDFRHSMQIQMPATYTEAFSSVLIVDDVRIRK